MYHPADVFEHIRAHQAGFIVLGTITMVAALVWYVESLQVAHRDKVISMPILTTLAWFGHDTSYVLRFHDWFHTYDFWFFKGLWCYMVPLVVIEVIWIVQIIKYARTEFFPTIEPRAFIAGVLASVAACAIGWLALKHTLDDPLYIVSMQLTVLLYAAAGMALTLRRGTRNGQSLRMWIACIVMFATWSTATILWLGAPFHDWRWIAVSAVTTAWLVADAALLARMPATDAR